MVDLTKNEELILLAIGKLRGKAYIVTIRKNLAETIGKSFNYGSLCNTLASLGRKGFIISQNSAPKAKQGGRRKVLYFLTEEGKKALLHAYKVQNIAWSNVPIFVLFEVEFRQLGAWFGIDLPASEASHGQVVEPGARGVVDLRRYGLAEL